MQDFCWIIPKMYVLLVLWLLVSRVSMLLASMFLYPKGFRV